MSLAHTEDLNELFLDSITDQPMYSPDGKTFGILSHEAEPYLPWICRVPWGDQKRINEEPVDHPAGVQKLTKITYGIPETAFQTPLTNFLERNSMVVFEPSDQHRLTLEFDNGKQG
jgi:hypothetical protein